MKLSLIYFLFFFVITSSILGQRSDNIEFLANWDDNSVPYNGTAKYNDVWGFVVNGEEFGCIGSTMGTHIFHLPEDNEITEVGFVPGAFQRFVTHRDFAFHKGYLYAVCDQGTSSLQVIDVSQLPERFDVVLDDSTYVKTAHNVTVDDFGEKLYISGPTGAAMKVFDISNTPEAPEFLMDFDALEYIHDVYVRRDTAYLSAGNQGLFIYDFSDGDTSQIMAALTSYPDQGYNHSGWASANGQYYAFADETLSMRMKVIDITDFSDLKVVSLFNSGWNEETAPHNLEWVGDKIYVSHYYDGLQVFDVSDPENPVKVAYYDTYTKEDKPWRGAWGVHVMPSGRILVSDRQTGFYMFELSEPEDTTSVFSVYPNPAVDGEIYVHIQDSDFSSGKLQMFDARGKRVIERNLVKSGLDLNYLLEIPQLSTGAYYLRLQLDNQLVDQKTVFVP